MHSACFEVDYFTLAYLTIKAGLCKWELVRHSNIGIEDQHRMPRGLKAEQWKRNSISPGHQSERSSRACHCIHCVHSMNVSTFLQISNNASVFKCKEYEAHTASKRTQPFFLLTPTVRPLLPVVFECCPRTRRPQ